MRLSDEGMSIVAGPFLDNQQVKGIFIFNASSIEEVKKPAATFPAIKADVLEMDLRRWYGSAAMIEVTCLPKII